MNAKAKLQQLGACTDAIDWIGDRTIEQAWRECRRSDWMLWLLRLVAPNDHRCRLAAADFAERVWNLIDNEPARRTAAWAIGAARRGDANEMMAAATASASFYAASDAASYAATYAAERAAQADILRGYFTPREIAKLLDAAIAKEGER